MGCLIVLLRQGWQLHPELPVSVFELLSLNSLCLGAFPDMQTGSGLRTSCLSVVGVPHSHEKWSEGS